MYSIWNANSPSITEVEMWEVSILLNAVVQTLVQHLHTVWLIFFHWLLFSFVTCLRTRMLAKLWSIWSPVGKFLEYSQFIRDHDASFTQALAMENGKIRKYLLDHPVHDVWEAAVDGDLVLDHHQERGHDVAHALNMKLSDLCHLPSQKVIFCQRVKNLVFVSGVNCHS